MSGPKYAIVEPADYERLRKYEWFVMVGTGSFYSFRQGPGRKVRRAPIIYMHQDIIQVPKGMLIDHINHNGMDNREANLRAATHSQNMCNRKKLSNAKFSKYKGVSLNKLTHKWVARIGINNKIIHLGSFLNEIDAAKAYDLAARKYHGEFASLNFPE